MARLQDDRGAVVERFQATSGRVTGWLTVVLGAFVVVAGVAYLDDGFPAWVAAAGLLVGVLAWAAMLRPALWATEEHLVMRNLAETVHVRLAAVEEMAVRQVLAVRAGDRRYVSTVVGRSWRKAITSRHPRGSGDEGARVRGCPTRTGSSTGSTSWSTTPARSPASGPARRSSWRCPTPYDVSRRGCRWG